MNLDPVSAVLDIGGKLIDRLWPNPKERDAAKLKLFELQQSGELAKLAAETELAKGQLAVNEKEAENPSLFVSGWRPAIGWVCGLALAYQFILRPLGGSLAGYFGLQVPPMPGLDDTLWQLLFGMLGLGGLRTFEKVKGVAGR